MLLLTEMIFLSPLQAIAIHLESYRVQQRKLFWEQATSVTDQPLQQTLLRLAKG